MRIFLDFVFISKGDGLVVVVYRMMAVVRDFRKDRKLMII